MAQSKKAQVKIGRCAEEENSSETPNVFQMFRQNHLDSDCEIFCRSPAFHVRDIPIYKDAESHTPWRLQNSALPNRASEIDAFQSETIDNVPMQS